MSALKQVLFKKANYFLILIKSYFIGNMVAMNDTELIAHLGGTTAVARMINKKLREGDSEITPQRVNGWRAKNKIPPYFKLAYPKVFKVPSLK